MAAGVLGVVSLITGLGLDWVSGSLSTPAKVRLAITPSTALGYTVAHAFGVAGSSKAIESAFGVVTLALTAGLGAWLLYRVRFEPARLVARGAAARRGTRRPGGVAVVRDLGPRPARLRSAPRSGGGGCRS